MFKPNGFHRSGLGMIGCILIGFGISFAAHAGYTNGPDPHGKPPCCTGSGSSAAGSSGSTGMPTYSVNPMLIGLVLQDTPLDYAPPKGPAIDFELTYNQKDTGQPAAFTFGNVGPKWAFNWLEYVQDNPVRPGSQVLLYLPDGQGRVYSGYNGSNGTFALEPETGAILVLVSTSPVTYERRMPDGSKEVFSASDGATSYPRHIFLTQRIDAHGNAVTLSYDGQQRLTDITDALGRTSTLQYGDGSDPLLITKVTDPFGRSAVLAYDANGRLSSITDAIGMTSSFGYATGSQINSLTTPYGTTAFDYGESDYHYWLNITDTRGDTSRWEFLNGAPGIPFSESLVPSGVAVFNRYINGRNSFYWDPSAYAQFAGDYTKAKIYHWEHEYIGGFSSTTSDVLESIKYPDENRIWYDYPGGHPAGTSGTLNRPTATGRVLADGSTQLTTHQYNGQGNVTRAIDGAGLETDTTYAANGIDPVLITYSGPGGYHATESFTYNGQHEPLSHTDESGAMATYTYNAAGQRTSATDPLGHTTHYNYDGNGYLASVTDPDSHTTSYAYDAIGRKASETDPLGNTKTYAYDALNRVTRITYWDGTLEQNTYDKLDRIAHRDRNGNVTQYAYDAMRNLVAITDPLGRVTRFTYYPNNLMHTRTDTTGGVTTWTRDIEGRVTQRQDPNGGIAAFAFDTANRKIAETNPLGQSTLYLAYDGDNRLTRVEDANGVITDTVYYPRGWFATRSIRANTDGSPSTGDATTTMTYDAVGDLASITAPDGVMRVFAYDAAHRLTDVGDALGNSISYTLDPAGNRTAEVTYDAGSVATRSISRTFDVRNEVASTTNGAGDTTAYGYDANGNRSDMIDPLGVRTHWSFDAGDRLVSSTRNYLGTDPATTNTATGYGYDTADHLIAVTDPDNLVTGYQVDAMGRVTRLTGPDTGTTTYTYDAAGDRTSQTDARSITSTYTYDLLKRPTSTSYPTASLDVQYDYDEPNTTTGCASSFPIGHLTRMTDSSGSTAYCYDNRGNVTRKQQVIASNTYVTTYAYNLADRLMATGYPDGTSVTYTRDADGRIVSVTATSKTGITTTVVTAINYLPFGPASGYAFGNGLTLAKTFDHAYRSTGVVSTPLYLQYTLDAAGNPVALKDAPGQTSPVETYQYDPLYRLQQVNEAGTPWQAYTYDRTGDRLTKTGAEFGTDVYQYQGGTHRLGGITGDEQSLRTLDASGNTTSIKTLGTGMRTLTYNDANRLAAIQKGTGTTQYFLNGKGERVRKQQPYVAASSNYIHDEAGHLLAEYRDVNGVSTDYIWADGIPVALYWGHGPAGASQLRYVLTDGLGTPRAAMTPAKTPQWTWPAVRNPFGERAASTYGGYQNLRFPGQYYDAETGLHYNMFRDYEPGTGRYIESDPIGLRGGISTFAYVNGAPLRHSDPQGKRVVATYPVPADSWPTIQCDGSGGISIFYGHRYSPEQMECFGECITQHEQKHINDYKFVNPIVCAGKPQGFWVRSTSQEFADMDEVRAYKVGIACLMLKLEAAEHEKCSKCKQLIQAQLDNAKDQYGRYKYRYDRERSSDGG